MFRRATSQRKNLARQVRTRRDVALERDRPGGDGRAAVGALGQSAGRRLDAEELLRVLVLDLQGRVLDLEPSCNSRSSSARRA